MTDDERFMTEAQSTKSEERGADGRFAPGKSGNPATQWGPDNPPPRSPGRPRKDAWVGALERLLERDKRLPDAFAARLTKIALKGRDSDALKALEIIQSRTGGPVRQQVEDVTDRTQEPRRIYIVQTGGAMPEMPPEVRALEEARQRAEDGLPPAGDAAPK